MIEVLFTLVGLFLAFPMVCVLIGIFAAALRMAGRLPDSTARPTEHTRDW